MEDNRRYTHLRCSVHVQLTALVKKKNMSQVGGATRKRVRPKKCWPRWVRRKNHGL